MNELRKKFEALPQIKELLDDREKSFFFNEDFEVYGAEHLDDFDSGFINGAWYVFQEQQKKIDAALEFTCDVHSENWQEFMHCIQELLK